MSDFLQTTFYNILTYGKAFSGRDIGEAVTYTCEAHTERVGGIRLEVA